MSFLHFSWGSWTLRMLGFSFVFCHSERTACKSNAILFFTAVRLSIYSFLQTEPFTSTPCSRGIHSPLINSEFTRWNPFLRGGLRLHPSVHISREHTLDDIKVLASDGKFEDHFPYCSNWIHLEIWSTSLFCLRWGHLRWVMALRPLIRRYVIMR